jgi:hypothetical protein
MVLGAEVRWLVLLLGCAPGAVSGGGGDGGRVVVLVASRPDAGLPGRIDSWLRWQAAVAGLDRDGGQASALRRARAERALLDEARLTAADVEAVEGLVAAVVAERTVARLSGSQALDRFGAALDVLTPEQRARAQAALEATGPRSDGGALPGLVERLGVEAVRAVLDREAEVTRAWEAQLEAPR